MIDIAIASLTREGHAGCRSRECLRPIQDVLGPSIGSVVLRISMRSSNDVLGEEGGARDVVSAREWNRFEKRILGLGLGKLGDESKVVNSDCLDAGL